MEVSMPTSPRPLMGALAILAALAACGSSDNTTPPALTVTASVDTGAVSTVTNGVKADGASTVTIHVAGSAKGPIRVITRRGTFPGGVQTANIDGTSGTVQLTACDARTDATCAGNVNISATDANLAFGQITLTFIGFEPSCTSGRDDNKDGRIGC